MILHLLEVIPYAGVILHPDDATAELVAWPRKKVRSADDEGRTGIGVDQERNLIFIQHLSSTPLGFILIAQDETLQLSKLAHS